MQPLHCVSLSGGKDSTAMLLMMIEKGMPIDYILFCDTGKEFPEMYEHLEKLADYIKPYEITTLRADKSFDYYMFEHKKTKGKRQDEYGYAWADMKNRWCTQLLKKSIIANFLKGKNVIQYIGIAADEPKRITRQKNKRYPLYEWGVTEKMALRYCYEKDFFWGSLYGLFKRVSCWCCPLKSLDELKTLYQYFPYLWQELKDMDNRSRNQFRADYSVQQLEDRFKAEDEMERNQYKFGFAEVENGTTKDKSNPQR